MQRGDVVTVMAYPNKSLERIVWEVHGTYVLVCRLDIYQEAIGSDEDPESTMGFPIEDVQMTIKAR